MPKEKPGQLKSLGTEMQKALEQRRAFYEARQLQRFKEVLQGREDQIDQSQKFKSTLPGIRTINILKIGAGTGKPLSTAAILEYGPENHPKNTTVSIGSKGETAWQQPKELSNIWKEHVLEEVLDCIESMDLAHTIRVKGDLFEPDQMLTGAAVPLPTQLKGGAAWQGIVLDRDRINTIQKLNGKIFTAIPDVGGFRKYQVTAFENCGVFESEMVDNALYIVDWTRPLDASQIKKDIGGMTPQEQQQLFENLPWPIQPPFTKNDIRKVPNTARIIHTGDWKDRLADEVARRNP